MPINESRLQEEACAEFTPSGADIGTKRLNRNDSAWTIYGGRVGHPHIYIYSLHHEIEAIRPYGDVGVVVNCVSTAPLRSHVKQTKIKKTILSD